MPCCSGVWVGGFASGPFHCKRNGLIRVRLSYELLVIRVVEFDMSLSLLIDFGSNEEVS